MEVACLFPGPYQQQWWISTLPWKVNTDLRWFTPLKINGWNIIMEVWFRWFSFLNGWFIDSSRQPSRVYVGKPGNCPNAIGISVGFFSKTTGSVITLHHMVLRVLASPTTQEVEGSSPGSPCFLGICQNLMSYSKGAPPFQSPKVFFPKKIRSIFDHGKKLGCHDVPGS